MWTNSSSEKKFIYYEVPLFNMYDSGVLGVLTELWIHHHYQIPEYSHHSQKKSYLDASM